MPNADRLIKDYFTEIYSHSQTVEVSRNKAGESRGELGTAKGWFCLFFFFKDVGGLQGKWPTAKPALLKATVKGHNLKSCYKNSVICFN